MEISFEPAPGCPEVPLLHTLESNAGGIAMLRFFARDPGHSRRKLDRCLASLERAGLDHGAIQVIEKRQSSSANRNEAFRACSRSWVCFMDDDAELASPSTLEVMLRRAEENQAALCGPKLLTSIGRIYSGQPCADPVSLEARVAGIGEEDRGQHDATAIVPWLPSTVLLAHRSVILVTGGFDEQYAGSQYEDADFSLRARSRGFRCCYAGCAVAIHHNQLRNAHFVGNMAYFQRRWRDRRDLFLPETLATRSE